MPADKFVPLNLDRDSKVPVYQQVYEGLREAILRGELAAGASLPAERELAKSLAIDRLTLRRSLNLLEKERLLQRRQGVGTFVESSSKWVNPQNPIRLGILIWNDTSYYLLYLGRLCETAAQLGMETTVLRSGSDTQRLQARIADLGLQGLVATPNGKRRDVECLNHVAIPKVMLETKARTAGTDHVVVDSFPGVYAGVTELVRLGHRRIAYIGGMVHDRDSQDPGAFRLAQDSLSRLEALRQALEDAQIEFDQELYREIPYEQSDAERVVQELFRRKQPPTALVLFDDMLANFVLNALRERKLAVPGDVSVLGFGNTTPEARGGGLATVRVDFDRMAEAAANRIHERIRSQEASEITIPVPTQFKPGQSLAAPKNGK